jgi:hypothetical protein
MLKPFRELLIIIMTTGIGPGRHGKKLDDLLPRVINWFHLKETTKGV